ncbi:MAG: hypothetical protein SFZ23_10105 [Planctomycetota bacterium]|nr:hypothetical protein [Planctomycetota bacterium]
MSFPSSIAASGPLLPVWIMIVLGGVTLLVLAAHLTAMARADMPPSRKRIRTANGLLMMFLTPVIAYAFSVASPGEPRQFVSAFAVVIGGLGLVVILAVLDGFNNVRLYRVQRRQTGREMALAMARERALRRDQRAGSTGDA